MTPLFSSDPVLFTVLPATGDYCVEVADCNAVFGAEKCAPASGITNKRFALSFSTLNESWENYTNNVEPNDTPANATPIKYGKNTNGQYLLSIVKGELSGAGDVDVFKVKLPADQEIDGRSLGNFAVQKMGSDQNGSTLSSIILEVAAASDPDTVLARISSSGEVEELSAPIPLDTEYLLTVRRNGSTPGARDFYFLLHWTTGSNPLELEPNDTLAEAQELTFVEGSTRAFIEGDIEDGDVDFFSAAVPQGQTKVSVFCGARTLGSGLIDLRAALVTDDGSEINGASDVETATKEIAIQNVAVPAGAAKVHLKLNASGQDAHVAGTYYRCGIVFTK